MDNLFNKVLSLAKRRGFVFPSSEIYGGLTNSWDFGPLGVLLKNNIRDFWWRRFVLERDDIFGIDASTILNPKVWEASGHVQNFTDALIDCKNCQYRTRADHLIEENVKDIKVEGLPVSELTRIINEQKIKCPSCGSFSWTEVRKFNLLFETNIGILEEGRQKAYLRGELAQGIFLNFRNILDTMRVKIPFGIAQQGKAFRNEITAGQFIHRTLEFDLMELEYFIHPRDWEDTYEYWRKEMWKWAVELGLSANNLRWREHEEFERSHYSKKTMDIEYKYPFGWKEMFGIAYRTDFDLKNHSKHSGKDLSYQDPQTHERFIPHVIEPTFGLSRLVGIILFDSYFEDNSTKEKRIVLRLKPLLAPYKVAVFPLLANKKELVDKALFVLDKIKAEGILPAVFDDRGNIGKRYYYQDEIGTPFCVTIDFQTLSDNTITVRDRDTTKQERVAIEKLPIYLKKKIGS